MARDKEFAVYGDNGLKGKLFAAARYLDPSEKKRVRLDDGREIVVPSTALVPQPDGSFYLKPAEVASPRPETARPEPLRPEPPRPEMPRPEPPAPPAKPETPVAAAPVPSPAPPPEQPPLTVMNPFSADSLLREDCEVERVTVQRYVDKPEEIRMDGDTLIVPLMEEVLVVEKRLMVREELHIKRRREQKPPNPISAAAAGLKRV